VESVYFVDKRFFRVIRDKSLGVAMVNDSGRRWYRYVDNGCILGLVVSVLLLVNGYISGSVEPLGVYPGILVGVLGGAAIFMVWWHSAKKGRFILGGEGTFRFRIWHFGTVFVLGVIISVPIWAELSKRRPEINIPNLITTFFTFWFVSFSSVGVLGIYWLQRHYGKRFYLEGK
jgi:hypothetical protein